MGFSSLKNHRELVKVIPMGYVSPGQPEDLFSVFFGVHDERTGRDRGGVHGIGWYEEPSTIEWIKDRISKGRMEPLSGVQAHGMSDTSWIKRYVLDGGYDRHIEVVHKIDKVPENPGKYCLPHMHPFDEHNMILGSGDGSRLFYEIVLDGQKYTVKSPAKILIPAGSLHSQNAISGSGYFIATMGSPLYSIETVTSPPASIFDGSP